MRATPSYFTMQPMPCSWRIQCKFAISNIGWGRVSNGYMYPQRNQHINLWTLSQRRHRRKGMKHLPYYLRPIQKALPPETIISCSLYSVGTKSGLEAFREDVEIIQRILFAGQLGVSHIQTNTKLASKQNTFREQKKTKPCSVPYGLLSNGEPFHQFRKCVSEMVVAISPKVQGMLGWGPNLLWETTLPW